MKTALSGQVVTKESGEIDWKQGVSSHHIRTKRKKYSSIGTYLTATTPMRAGMVWLKCAERYVEREVSNKDCLEDTCFVH